MTNRDNISEAARRLNSLSPELFQHFVKTFETYTHEVTVAVAEAAPENILAAQGRAQQCLALLRIFRECTIEVKPKPPVT